MSARPSAARLLLALGAATATYLALAPVLGLPAPWAPGSQGSADDRASDAVAFRRLGELPAFRALPAPQPGDPLPPHPRLTREEAARFFNLEERVEYEPDCGAVYRAHLERRRAFSEHPDGGWTFRTNGLGLREDAEPRPDPLDLRVLVAGDSHTDGVCAQHESFPNRLEARLAARFPEDAIDVLNAGRGGYSFYNYEGTLRRFLRLGLRPDVFVVAVYGGNDFEEYLTLHHWLRGEQRPGGAREYWPQLERALYLRRPAVAQALQSLKYFAAEPAEEPIAVEAAVASIERLRETCRIEGVRLLVLYLPAVHEVDPGFEGLRFEALCEALELAPDARDSTTRLADAFLAGCARLGVEALDLRPAFRRGHSEATPFYWHRDLHISLAAHEAIAALLEARLAP